MRRSSDPGNFYPIQTRLALAQFAHLYEKTECAGRVAKKKRGLGSGKKEGGRQVFAYQKKRKEMGWKKKALTDSVF